MLIRRIVLTSFVGLAAACSQPVNGVDSGNTPDVVFDTGTDAGSMQDAPRAMRPATTFQRATR